MIDLCQDWLTLAAKIDQTADPEWDKAAILKTQPDWLDFVGKLTGAKPKQVGKVLDGFDYDNCFKMHFQQMLKTLSAMKNAGDLRFHSLTLHCLVRLTRPMVVIETGVASGKSSAMILSALNHNNQGRLYSIDLPNPAGVVLLDGALTNTGEYPAGWLVPDYLKGRWTLKLGDSKKLLPRLLNLGVRPDLFLHDSLHTPEHVLFELETVKDHLQPGALILVDNADLVKDALDGFMAKYGLEGWRYRDFAGVKWHA